MKSKPGNRATGFAASALALLLCSAIAGRAFAGPNAGGTLLMHANPSLIFTTSTSNYCGQSGLTTCEAATTHLPQSTTPTLWFVVAAFPEFSQPHVTGVSFGLGDYDPTAISMLGHGSCANFEADTQDWPGPNTGTSLSWSSPRGERLIELYWFAGYAYTEATLALGPHPTFGGYFVDNSPSPVSDAIAGYSSLGFGALSGHLVCPIPPANGACCSSVDGACSVLTPDLCAALPGTYLGDDQPCPAEACAPSGACCLDSGQCSLMLQGWCAQSGGVFHGEGVPCSPNICPRAGACCHPDGHCVFTIESECQASGGIYYGAGSCAPNQCPQPLGTCCSPAGDCTVVPESQCNEYLWTEGAACSPNPCPQPQAACCFPDGHCEVQNSSHCEQLGGTFMGVWTGCEPSPCGPALGACCLPDGSCVLSTTGDCVGTWQGDFTECSPNPCPQPMGACCAIDGSCSLTTSAACEGSWEGPDSPCAPALCPTYSVRWTSVVLGLAKAETSAQATTCDTLGDFFDADLDSLRYPQDPLPFDLSVSSHAAPPVQCANYGDGAATCRIGVDQVEAWAMGGGSSPGPGSARGYAFGSVEIVRGFVVDGPGGSVHMTIPIDIWGERIQSSAEGSSDQLIGG